MPTRNVNLTDELDSFVLAKVESGRYGNASEVVRAALRTLEREEQQYEAKLAALRTAIDEGHASRVLFGTRPTGIDQHYATRADLALDKAFVIIDRQDPFSGNVASLTAACYSESRLSTRIIAGCELCVEPAALRRHFVAGKQSQPQAHASQPRLPTRNIPRGWGQ